MKNFVYGMLGAVVVVTVYHLAVGLIVYRVNSDLFKNTAEESNKAADPVYVVLHWPRYVAAINTMNHAWVDLMGDVKETLRKCDYQQPAD